MSRSKQLGDETPCPSNALKELRWVSSFIVFSTNRSADFCSDDSSGGAEIKTLANAGDDKSLHQLPPPYSEGLGELLRDQRRTALLHAWSVDQQAWAEIDTFEQSEQTARSQVNLVLFLTGGNGAIFGMIVTVFNGDLDDIKVAQLHHIGLTVLSKFAQQNISSERQYTLSNGEKKVLLWCGNGKTSFEISKILGLSEHTVNHYITSAVSKLDATNRTHAIAKAIRWGVINAQDIN